MMIWYLKIIMKKVIEEFENHPEAQAIKFISMMYLLVVILAWQELKNLKRRLEEI